MQGYTVYLFLETALLLVFTVYPYEDKFGN